MIKIDASLLSVPDGPVVLSDNTLLDSALTFSSETPDGFAANALDTYTNDFWKPATTPAWIQSAGVVGRTVDCLGICAHTIASVFGAVRAYTQSGQLRTNKHLNSEQFISGWGTTGADSSIVSTPMRSPAGRANCGLLSCTTVATATRRCHSLTNISVTPSAQHWVSVFVKAKNWSWVGVNFAAGTSLSEIAASTQINLTTGARVDGAGQFSVAKLDDGWWRISALCTTGASSGYRLSVALLPGQGSPSASAAGVVGAGVYVTGFHVEQTTVPGRGYIRTDASPVPIDRVYLADPVFPSTNEPLVVLMGSRLTDFSVGLEVCGETPPSVGVLFLGESIAIDAGLQASYTPLYLAREIDLSVSRSRTGHYLGAQIERRGASGRIQLTPMLGDYVQGELAEFISHFDDGKPFFYSASPAMFPLDVGYCWRSGSGDTCRPVYDDAGLFMSVGLEVEAIVQ